MNHFKYFRLNRKKRTRNDTGVSIFSNNLIATEPEQISHVQISWKRHNMEIPSVSLDPFKYQ